jgi:hypothetical protein
VIRTALAAVLLILLLPAAVIANASNWAARTVVDDGAFASTVGRVMDTPTLRTVIADRISDEVATYLSRTPETFTLLATEILHVPPGTSIDDVRAALRARLATALDDPSVRAARERAIESVHAYLIGATTGADQAVRIQGDQLVLDTGPLVEKLAAAMDPRLTPATVALPEADRLVVLASAGALETASDAISLMEIGRFLIPIVAIIAALAILGLAHRRVRALGLVGIAVMLAGAVTLAAAWLGGEAIGQASADITVRQITTEVYTAFITLLVWQAVALIVGGLVLALIAWLLVRRRRAARAGGPSGQGGSSGPSMTSGAASA